MATVRSVLILSTLALATGLATAGPGLTTAELRVAYGLAAGGGAGRSTLRGTPLVLTAGASLAIRDRPPTSAYVAMVVETLDRTGAGGEAGVLLTPTTRTRLRAGAVAIVAPYTIWGAAVGGGVCWPVGGVRTCADITADVLVGGTDLPAGAAVLQLLLGVGVVFDAD